MHKFLNKYFSRNSWKTSWFQRRLGGHVTIGKRVTIYGWNAMHVAVNIWTKRWGYICFHPTIRVFGHWWPWYFYVSRDATPHEATFKLGPGVFYG
jgi:hypothetical protein